MKQTTELFATLDRSIRETAERAQFESKIKGRMRHLLRENGLAYHYSEEDALKQALLEAVAVRPRR